MTDPEADPRGARTNIEQDAEADGDWVPDLDADPSIDSRPIEAVCHVCGKTFAIRDLRGWDSVRPDLSEVIAREQPGWGPGCAICRADLAGCRSRLVASLIEVGGREPGPLEREVVKSIETGELVSRDAERELEGAATLGDRTADAVARVGGSWPFILIFLGLLAGWIALNAGLLMSGPFDPYPFILLNLVLSTLAAIQAPVIMMSQRRQETKDRLRARNDYLVNLKAELEIRQLHDKLDHHMAHQWERLVRLQQIQIDLLEEQADARA